jgi:oligopeptide/dipeptide ABC transporter ATP-binding protein
LTAARGALLQVEELTKEYRVRGRAVRGASLIRAVDSVDLELARGETLALVGESGCGKSTTGRMIVRLLEPTAGRIVFDGEDITHLGRRALRSIRSKLQIVFQDPFASLNPRLRVRDIIAEPLRIHGLYAHGGGRQRVLELLDRVSLASDHAERFPHELSGGQRQRIAIARALALDPQLVVLDEPVSALDLSVQAQIINLLEELQDELGLAYLFISHDLTVVRHISNRVAVMYLGRIVELGDADEVFERPRHPYTNALLSAAPVMNPRQRGGRARIRLTGELPNPTAPPPGCTFHSRCWKVATRCRQEAPLLEGPEHAAACFFPVDEHVAGER